MHTETGALLCQDCDCERRCRVGFPLVGTNRKDVEASQCYRNYRSYLSFCLSVNFNLVHSTSLYDEVERKPWGTKIDVYLVVPFSITFITRTSYLSGTSLVLGFSESDNAIC